MLQQTQRITPGKITLLNTSLRFGIYAFFATIVYFLLLALLGLHKIPWFYLGNFVILGYMIVRANKHYVHAKHPDYISVFLNGMLMSTVMAFLYGVFIMLYLGVFDLGFLGYLQENVSFGPYVTPYSAGIVTFITQAAGGFFMGYVLALFFFDDTEAP